MVETTNQHWFFNWATMGYANSRHLLWPSLPIASQQLTWARLRFWWAGRPAVSPWKWGTTKISQVANQRYPQKNVSESENLQPKMYIYLIYWYNCLHNHCCFPQNGPPTHGFWGFTEDSLTVRMRSVGAHFLRRKLNVLNNQPVMISHNHL